MAEIINIQGLLDLLFGEANDKARVEEISLENNSFFVKENYRTTEGDIYRSVHREIGKGEKINFKELNLTGFNNLEKIEIKNISLDKTTKRLNCSNLAKLKKIDCQDGRLEEINLTGCTELVSLDLRSNRLAALDAVI